MDIEEIRNMLKDSIQDRFMDYTDVQINRDNEETYLQTLKTLDATKADARKRHLFCMPEGTSVEQNERNHREEDVATTEVDELFASIYLFFD